MINRYLISTISFLFATSLFAQKIELLDTAGNRYVGTITTEDKSKVCIITKNKNVLCFDSSQYVDYGEYHAYNRAYPLTKELNPIVISHDFGMLFRTNVAGSGIAYSFGIQKRLSDHTAVGFRTSLGFGDFVELNIAAIGTYQFEPSKRFVNTLSLSAGALKEFVYWSEQGFDINLEYALLLRKERSKSNRIFISTGLHSAKYVWCSGIDCISYNHRAHALQLKLGYGWQF